MSLRSRPRDSSYPSFDCDAAHDEAVQTEGIGHPTQGWDDRKHVSEDGILASGLFLAIVVLPSGPAAPPVSQVGRCVLA